MEERNIPVPAESLRTIAASSTEAIHRSREEGRKATARQIELAVSEAYEALDGRDGEFVSVSADALSTLCARSVHDMDADDETWRHSDAAQVFLEKYGIWG